MESVAADALLVELFGQGVAVGNVWVTAVKGRVETGDLRELRLSLPERADGTEIVRLVKRGKRREGLKPLKYRIVDQDRLAIVRPAMHDPVAYRRRQRSNLFAQELYDFAQGGGYVGHVRDRPGVVDEDLALHVLGDKPWTNADALNLAFEATLQLITGASREQLKLYARATGVDDEDRVRHGVRP